MTAACDQFLAMVESAEVIHDMPEADYHASSGFGPDLWLTRSIIADHVASPGGWNLRYVKRDELAQRKGATAAMDLGTMFDILLTEGQEAYDRRVVEPKATPPPQGVITPSGGVSTSKLAKEAIAQACRSGTVWEGVPATYRAWQDRLPADCLERKPDEHAKVLYMRERLLSNPLASALVGASDSNQLVIRATLKNGLRLQCRLDFWLDGIGLPADLKTTCAEEDGFHRHAKDRGYYLQAWFYTVMAQAAGLNVRHDMSFVCQMNCYPWDSYVAQLWNEATGEKVEYKAKAGGLFMSALDAIANDKQPAPQKSPRVLRTPLWLLHWIEEGE